MANLTETISDHFPPASGVAIPLGSNITIDFSRDMDEDRLEEDVFVEGPDTDQFVGPGLSLLQIPNNISQGDLDDFLKSPGYAGIVQGDYTFTTISGVSTVLVFDPTRPLAPNTTYVVHVAETLDALGNTVSGHVTWSFETGTGSITEIPSTISTSILASAPSAQDFLTSLGPLSVVKTVPFDHAVEQDPKLIEISVEFNKDLNASTLNDGTVFINVVPATDHPGAGVTTSANIYRVLEIVGKILKIKL